MKRFLPRLSALLLTLSIGSLYAQKNTTDNDYNLHKAYEVLREDNDCNKAI